MHNWTSSGFNDSGWTNVNTIQNESFPADWNGKGWFRFHFTIDSSLFNKSVFLRIWSAGKQEVYLDGKYITDNSDWKHSKVITFNQERNHIIAVKYTNNDSRYYSRCRV